MENCFSYSSGYLKEQALQENFKPVHGEAGSFLALKGPGNVWEKIHSLASKDQGSQRDTWAHWAIHHPDQIRPEFGGISKRGSVSCMRAFFVG